MTSESNIIFSSGNKTNKANGICLNISQVGLTVCELDIHSSKPVYLADYKNNQETTSSPVSMLSDALKMAQVQLKNYDKTFINFSGTKFTLVPVAFFDESNARAILEFNCGEANDDIILFDDINADIKLIYSINESLKSTIDKLFANHHLKHTAGILSKLLLQSDEMVHEHILLNIDHSSIFIVAKKDGKLVLCNQYQAQTDEDILYYVLFVLEQFELNPLTVKISIAGNIEVESSLAKALKKYIKHVRFVTGNKLIKREDILSVPHHYYYSTLNRLFCE